MLELQKKIWKVKTRILQRQIKENQCFYQKMLCAIVKNRDLPKIKKLFGY